jgi:hypothetical protein
MTKNGILGNPHRSQNLISFFIIISIMVTFVWFGVWLQRKVLGIDRLEERIYRLETKLSE